MNPSKKITLCVLLFLISFNSSLSAFEYEPPGVFYLMFGAFRMYIHCEGEGKTPIIIDTGIGDSLANWLPIQKSLSKHTRVCVYDRAGNGYSDPGPGPRTTSQIAFELYSLLKKAKIEGPYIMMGHSFGGYTAQYFAHQFPGDTAGLILVDSSHPDQVERLADLDKIKNKPKRDIGGYKFEDVSLLTPAQRFWKHLNAQRKSVWTQMDELDSFKDSADEVKRFQNKLPPIPLAVLTRGKSQLPVIEGMKSMELEWQSMQKELTKLTDQSWQIIVRESGHSIHQEAPDVVIDNALKVLQLAHAD